METLYIGSDHGGFEHKKSIMAILQKKGYNIIDIGPSTYDKDDDYPDYAEKLCKEVAAKGSKGMLICRSGHGMVISANKMRGIFASVCWNEESARRAKVDENINVLCLPADFVSAQEMYKIIETWLKAPYAGEERHARRQSKIRELEKKNLK